jgi:flagellin
VATIRIAHNISALSAWQSVSKNMFAAQKSLEKLSSGMRINRASDDSAGLAISEKMRAQIRGLEQTARNIQDAISLIQTAEGGMNEIHSLLQRGRELSVQAANDTNSESDRAEIQKEINQIIKEVNRIANNTEFNTKKLINVKSGEPEKEQLFNKLKNVWLGQAEQLISTYYGLIGDGVALNVVLEEGSVGGVLAYVSALVPPTGTGTNLELHIEMADYRAGNIDDTVIAHEMVHAVLNRTVNVGSATGIPEWFNEGLAEFIYGADNRLKNELLSYTAADIANDATDVWGGTSKEYAGAYAAVRYMHDKIKQAGGNGIIDVLNYLKEDTTRTLDQALQNVAGFSGLADFQTKWGADGAAYISSMNLNNADTGGIGGFDADGGPVRDINTVVPDTVDSVDHFNVIYPNIPTGSTLTFHLGSNSSQVLRVNLFSVDAEALGIEEADVISDASASIGLFDSAIMVVSANRAKLGAIQNRLEHAASLTENYKENLVASESRLRDVDMAKEMMNFTKFNILQQSAHAMLAQANQHPQGVLQILR